MKKKSGRRAYASPSPRFGGASHPPKIWVVILLFLSGGFLPLQSDTPQLSESSLKRAKQLHTALSRMAALGPDHLGYLAFASDYLEKKYELAALPFPSNDVLTRRRDAGVDAFALLSGGLAIRESLQLDRISLFKPEDDAVVLASLRGPEIKSHPFAAMMHGRASSAPGMAGLVPHDFYYLHIEDPGRFLDIMDTLSDSLGGMWNRFLPANVDFQTTEKLTTQLGLRMDPSNRKYYDSIISQIAVIGADPFFTNGSDLTLIYRLKQKGIFTKVIKEYREYYTARFRAVRSEMIMDGFKVQTLTTPDRRVYSLILQLNDDTIVISNSPAAMKAVIAVHQKKRPSMAEQDEYRYMRSIYPYEAKDGSKKEAAFLYLSDPFIRRITGPEMRIKEGRRTMEAARLAALERYAILYYQLRGKRPRTLASLRDEFPEEEIAHFDGLELSADSFAATSKALGPIGRMLPNIDYSLVNVSQAEADGYDKFLTNYNEYWRTYFDPIGIRLSGDHRVKIDTCILPLVENSFYDSLVEFLGNVKATKLTAADAALKGEVLSAGFKVNREQLARALSKPMKDHLDREGIKLENTLGEEIQIHVLDAQPMVDFDSAALMRETLSHGSPGDKALIGVLVWSLFHPIRIAVPLQKPEQGEKLLNVLDAMVRSELDSSSKWLRLDLYEQIVNGHRFRVYLISIEDIVKFRFYYAVHDGTLHITSTQQHMLQVLSGGLEKGIVDRFLDFFRTPRETTASVVGVFRPERLVAERDNFLAGAAESEKQAAFRNLSTFVLLHDLFGDRMNESSFDSFGFRLAPPDAFEFDAKGNPVSRIFGSPNRPVINMDRAKALKRPLDTEQIRLSLEFTKEGLKSTIEVDP